MTGQARDGELGFTLVEMIVALVLLALVLTLIGVGARVLRGTGDRLAERGEGLADLALFSTLVEERLGDAVQVDFGTPGKPSVSFDGNASRVRFLTIARDVQAGEPVLAMEIGTGSEAGIWLGLARLAADQRDFSALDDARRTERRLLLREVPAVRLSYFGRKEGEDPAWYDVWQEEARLPRAVRFDLGDARLALPPVIVPIRQRVGTLCASAAAELACPEP